MNDKIPKYLLIGCRIASLRSMVHLTQTKFARAIGITQSFLSELEAGKTKPSMPILLAIEYRFGYRAEFLLTGDEPIYRDTFTPPVIMPISGYETPDRVLMFWFNIVIRIFGEGNKAKIDLLKAQLRSLDPGEKRKPLQIEDGSSKEKKAM